MARQEEISVIIDAQNRAGRAISDVTNQLKNLGNTSANSLGQMQSSFNSGVEQIKGYTDHLGFMDTIAKKTFKGMAASAVAYGAISTNAFLNLNDGITSVNTLYDQTAYSQQKMYKDTIDMYRQIPTDFKNLTSATYNTISAGADPELASKYTKKFGKAAVAGDSDIDIVTTAAMGTMNAYKLEAKDLTRVLDLQFMTVKEGITSYSELASSLGTGILASAKGAGISLEDLQGSIALITKNAIPANIATTSLNQLFNKFTDTKVIKEFKDYGVAIQDSHKKTRPLIEIFKDLNGEFDKRNLSSEQRKGFLKELLGSDQAARAIAPLIGDLKEFERILDSMDNSDGAMKDAFGDKLESMKVQLKLMKNNIVASGVEQLYTLMPFIDKIMEPSVKKLKIEADIDDLRDRMEESDNPFEKQMLSQQIGHLQLKVKDIGIGPVEELRDALGQSVDELNKLNPPLAKFLDTIGNFALNFVGEEGEANRDTAKTVGKAAIGVYGFKKAIDALSWINEKMPKFGGKESSETVTDMLSKTVGTMNVNASVVYVNGSVLGSSLGTGVSSAVGSTVGTGIGFTAIANKVIKSLGETKSLNAPKGPMSLQAMFYIPKGFEVGGQHYQDAWQDTNRLTKQIQNKGNKNNTNPKANTGGLNELRKEVSIISNKLSQKQPEISDLKGVKNSVDLLKFSMAKDLAGLSKKETLIDNKIDLMNNIRVDVPKSNVSVYIDGKNIPARVMDSPKSVERNREITLRRYGSR